MLAFGIIGTTPEFMAYILTVPGGTQNQWNITNRTDRPGIPKFSFNNWRRPDNLRTCINDRSVKKLVSMVNTEIIAAKGGIRDQIAAMEANILDVNKHLGKLYGVWEIGELELADLAPRIKLPAGRSGGSP